MDIDDAIAGAPRGAFELRLLKDRHAPLGVLRRPELDVDADLTAARRILLKFFQPAPLPSSREPFCLSCTGSGQSSGRSLRNAGPSRGSFARSGSGALWLINAATRHDE